MRYVTITPNGQKRVLLVQSGTLGLALKQMADTSENAAKAQSATNSTATASTSAPTTSNNTSQTNGIETRRFEIVMGNKSATVYADANNGAQLENLITRLQQEALRS